MGPKSGIEYLIVDTSAFIKNAPLQEIGNKIITEPNVVDEIKSKRQIRRLVVLPYDLEVKEAFPEDIKFVTEFAKKTGDYISLSATDIKVIALTYRYEREKVGTSHLKTEPEKKKEIIDSSVLSPDEHPKNVIGFYMPDVYEDAKEEEDNDENNDDDDEEDDTSDSDNKSQQDQKKNNTINIKTRFRRLSENSICSNENKEDFVSESEISDESDTESDYNTARSEEELDEVNKLNKKFEKLQCDPTDLKIDCEDDLTIDDILKPIKNNICKENEEIQTSEDETVNSFGNEDDDEGWITPKNITNVKKQMDSGIVKDKPATVACLTMDFAMQNVMMQIGLNVASLEGKVIKEMRTFILRCYSCFKTTGITTKVFCPHCGNKTLKKVAVSLDDEGKQQIHINFRKPLTSKGKKYSLPTFQGGKHACNPILFEDQPLPDQRPTKLGRATNDPLHDDYTAGYSPFVMRDVNSRAAMLGVNSNFKYWMRKNPNEAKKYRK